MITVIHIQFMKIFRPSQSRFGRAAASIRRSRRSWSGRKKSGGSDRKGSSDDPSKYIVKPIKKAPVGFNVDASSSEQLLILVAEKHTLL